VWKGTQSVLKGTHRYRTQSVLKGTQSVLKCMHRYNLAQPMEMFFIGKIQSVVTLHTMNAMAVLIHNLRTIWGKRSAACSGCFGAWIKSQCCPLNRALCGLWSHSGCFGEEKKSCSCQQLNVIWFNIR
jgi:hypothetical protein